MVVLIALAALYPRDLDFKELLGCCARRQFFIIVIVIRFGCHLQWALMHYLLDCGGSFHELDLLSEELGLIPIIETLGFVHRVEHRGCA